MKGRRELTHASSRVQAVAEAGVDGEAVGTELDEELAVEVGPAQFPSPIRVVVLVPGTTHNEPSCLFAFLTVRLALDFLGEGPRASIKTSAWTLPDRASRSTWP